MVAATAHPQKGRLSKPAKQCLISQHMVRISESRMQSLFPFFISGHAKTVYTNGVWLLLYSLQAQSVHIGLAWYGLVWLLKKSGNRLHILPSGNLAVCSLL